MKKLIVTILTVVFSLTLAFGVVGCGNGDEGSSCEHKPGKTYTVVDNDYHSYKCTLCKETVQEKHKWKEGVVDGNGDPTYECSKCGVQKAR